MVIDPETTADYLSSPVPDRGVPEGVPRHEVLRSRAAARVGELAARGGVRTFHREHRVELPLPDAWRTEADEPEGWQDGVLPEPKYGAFRHDVPIASFNPGHRAKWTAHELCHALVGFAWRPDGSPLFFATAARLAELTPVLLWYFFDEIGLSRCPRHDGPLFRATCPACERAAAAGPTWVDQKRALPIATEATRFADRELAAIARTLRLGRPCPQVWGSIDLCSDGIAYAVGHGPRLRSRAFAAWAERFPSPLLATTLDDFQARVIAVAQAIADGTECPVAVCDWARMDLGQRLLDVWADCDGDCAGELLRVVDRLAAGATPAEAYAGYADLHTVYDLPDPDAVFAVGYDAPGIPGRSTEQVREGLASTAPMTMTLCTDADLDLVPAFVAADAPVRSHLGVRFGRFLAEHHPGPLAELAIYEAAVRTAGGEPDAVALGGGEGLRLAEGVLVHSFSFDVVAFAEQVDAGEVTGRADDGRVAVEGKGAPVTLAFARTRAGELVMAELRSDPTSATPEEQQALAGLGILVAERWTP